MDAHSTYKVTAKGTSEDLAAIAKSINTHFESEDNFDEHGVIEIVDTYEVVWLEDIQSMAADMATAATGSQFIIEGIIDTSAAAGEYMDFKISYDGVKLLSENSSWYLQENASMYEDYESFCEEMDFEENAPISEEEFDKILKENDGLFFILDSGDGDIVVSVPLSDKAELSID